MRRVVVTGMGLVTPLGCDLESVWRDLLACRSGIGFIECVDLSGIPCTIGGEVPYAGKNEKNTRKESLFDPSIWMSARSIRRYDDFAVMGFAAAMQAFRQSGLDATQKSERSKMGVCIGSAVAGLKSICASERLVMEKGHRRVSPFFVPGGLINTPSGLVAMETGFLGPNTAVGSACSTGAYAIGDSYNLVKHGDADVMIAGGTEASICRLGMAGFLACRALSTAFDDKPEHASRPYDKARDGFVMSEGAGALILEEYEHARARSAPIVAEIVGYGMSCDAYHITAPAPDGRGASLCMQRALAGAGLGIESINYINAHSTSTPVGDEIELAVVEKLAGQHAANLLMSSTKSSTGHMLGAAGAVEAIFSILAMRDGVAPATLNLDEPCRQTRINLCAHHPVERRMDAVMTNSFGFGGSNAALIFKRL